MCKVDSVSAAKYHCNSLRSHLKEVYFPDCFVVSKGDAK